MVTKLVDDYKAIKMKFAVLVSNTLQSLKAHKVSLQDLKLVIKTYLSENEVLRLFANAESLNNMFSEHLFNYWSFFDYELLAVIIESCCMELKSKLDAYIATFNEYCKRRCSEVPTSFMSKAEGEQYFTLTVKLSKELDQVKMEDVKELERKLKLFTKRDFSLSRFKDGCIELVFITLGEERDMHSLTKYGEELFTMGILKLYSASFVYYDCESSQLSLPGTGISQQEMKKIIDAIKESNKVEDLAVALGMSDFLEDNNDVGILLQQWQIRADPTKVTKRSCLLYHLARIGMEDLHARLVL